MNFYCFDYPAAIHLNNSRIEFIDSLGIDFKGKTVLETGMGARGDFSHYLHSKGAILYSFDARQTNCDEFKRRHPEIKNVFCINMETPNFLENIGIEKFDYILCVGTLYHLATPDKALDQLAKYSDNLILTTCVGGKNPGWNFVKEHGLNQCFGKFGCRPDLNFLLSELKKRYTTVKTHNVNHIEFMNGTRAAFTCSK